MAVTDKLTEVAIKNAKPKDKAYKLADGGGMYLEVTPTGAKYWRLKYRYADKEKRLALGVYPEVTLKEARAKKLEARKLLAVLSRTENRGILESAHPDGRRQMMQKWADYLDGLKQGAVVIPFRRHGGL